MMPKETANATGCSGTVADKGVRDAISLSSLLNSLSSASIVVEFTYLKAP